MALSSEQIPNKALNGREVLEIAVQEFRDMLARDCMFNQGIAYRRVAMTLSATFHLGKPHDTHEVKSRVKAAGVVEGEVPLRDPEDAALVALDRDVTLDNPNLARVHHDLPIRVQERGQPKPMVQATLPGEPPAAMTDPFPEVINKEIRYDKTQYPEAAAPVDRDVSEAKSAALGLKPRGRVGK